MPYEELPQQIGTPIASRSEELMTRIEHALSNADMSATEKAEIASAYDRYVTESYDELKKLNDVLTDRILREREEIETYLRLADEGDEVCRACLKLQKEHTIKKAYTKAEDSLAGTVTTEQPPLSSLRNTNMQLRHDLESITGIIVQQYQGHASYSGNTLHDLLQRLIARRLNFPDDPYINSREHVNQSDVQLLRDAWLIETYEDTDLICILDYSEA